MWAAERTPFEDLAVFGLQLPDRGMPLSLVELGDGGLMLLPQVSQVAKSGDAIAEQLQADEVSLEDLLDTLDEEREAYYREHYDDA